MRYLFYILLFLLSCTAQPILAAEVDFYGGIYRCQVNKPITVTWDDQNATKYELKIVHYFYTGVETTIVETTNNSYTFDRMPKTSRHFEIKVRSCNSTNGGWICSDWSSSVDAGCSVVDGSAGGWLIYTYPGGPSW